MPNLQADWPELIGLTGVTAAASMAAAWAFMKFFGAKVIGHQFDRRLEEFKAEQTAKIEAVRASQAQTLERLRFDIGASLDRTAKLHQFEFEVLPTAWKLLQAAVQATGELTARFRFGTDINSMGEKERRELFQSRGFTPAQREHIEEAFFGGPVKAQEAFNEVDELHRNRRAVDAYKALNACLLEQGIFIQADLRQRLREVAELIRNALYEQQDDREGLLTGKSSERRAKRDLLSSTWEQHRGEIEELLQGRLWNSRLPSIDQRAPS